MVSSGAIEYQKYYESLSERERVALRKLFALLLCLSRVDPPALAYHYLEIWAKCALLRDTHAVEPRNAGMMQRIASRVR